MAGYRIPGPQCVTGSELLDSGTTTLVRMPTPGPVDAGGAPGLDATGRIAEAIRRAIRSLPAEAGGHLSALLTPGTLATLAGVLVVWAGSHAFGVGEVVDVLLLATGFIFLGREAVEAVEHLVSFAKLALNAQSDNDLTLAGAHLAKAVTIIGVDAVLALLTRGGVKLQRGRYRPQVKGDPTLPAGEGWTTKFGDITYSTAGSATDRGLVLHHEKVHSLLSPKLMPLRELRADLGMAGYQRSSFLRYLEEAMAESYAQLRVNGIKGLPAGLRFPIANGYVTLRAVLTEAAVGATVMTITVAGIVYVVELELK